MFTASHLCCLSGNTNFSVPVDHSESQVIWLHIFSSLTLCSGSTCGREGRREKRKGGELMEDVRLHFPSKIFQHWKDMFI